MTCNKMPNTGLSIYSADFACEDRQKAMTCHETSACDFASWPIAMAYVPMQRWERPYDPKKGLQAGTIFRSLELPFSGGGCR